MGTDFHKELELQVLNNENTLDENKECLRNFCKESIEFNNKEVLDNKKESISDSIKKSSYCFFGLSTYINIAIKLNANVVAVETTHLNYIPFKSDYLNSESLNIFNPW